MIGMLRRERWTGRLRALALAAAMVAAAAGAVPGGAAASALQAENPARATPADSLRVFLVTFGPGSAVWERFGHNALWVHDPEAGTDIAYHYGLFDMSESGFILRFLQGRMFYSMGAADAGLLLSAYRRAGREATVQELRLTREQARELQAFLEWNMRPGNRVYRYDYFRDNCSTRVRDALDRVLDGGLSDALRPIETPITYRSEALALTAEDQMLTAGLDLGLGPLADQELTRWELGFVPMRLRDDVRRLQVERGGRLVPLVVSEREIPAIGVPDEEVAAPPRGIGRRIIWMLAAGLVGGALFVLLGHLVRRRSDGRSRAAGWGLAAAGSLWGLLTGVGGLVLLGLWLLTDHEFAHANENLLQASPLALGLVVLVPLAVLRGRGRWAFRLALAMVALSILGLLVYPLPVTPQATLGVIALALPIHLGLAHALRPS